MGRSPSCAKEGLHEGAWTHQIDKILSDYIKLHGIDNWREIAKNTGLRRNRKSCRLRWFNYLSPDIKRGNISSDEEDLIIRLQKLLGNKWSIIAARLPGRTDNEIKNYCNTKIFKKKVKDFQQQNTKNSSPNNANITENNPKPILQNSYVVRPKAKKCSKVLFMNPLPNSSTMHNLENDSASNNQMEHGNEFLSFSDAERELPTDLLFDFNTVDNDVCLSELLNSDFSTMFSDEFLKDLTS